MRLPAPADGPLKKAWHRGNLSRRKGSIPSLIYSQKNLEYALDDESSLKSYHDR